MTISADPAVIAAASHVVLPGVGAAGYAMRRIDELGLRAPILALTQPVLGICVGMQLLFERSEEDGGTDCLGIIPGSVRKLEPEPGRPVPHMGWARLHVVASATYGREIPAVVACRNFAGVQFHPERSSAAGSRLLRRFVGLP
jgi:glutamine amidotransferase